MTDNTASVITELEAAITSLENHLPLLWLEMVPQSPNCSSTVSNPHPLWNQPPAHHKYHHPCRCGQGSLAAQWAVTEAPVTTVPFYQPGLWPSLSIKVLTLLHTYAPLKGKGQTIREKIQEMYMTSIPNVVEGLTAYGPVRKQGWSSLLATDRSQKYKWRFRQCVNKGAIVFPKCHLYFRPRPVTSKLLYTKCNAKAWERSNEYT